LFIFNFYNKGRKLAGMNEILAGFKSDLEIENLFPEVVIFPWLKTNKELHYSFKISEEYSILA